MLCLEKKWAWSLSAFIMFALATNVYAQSSTVYGGSGGTVSLASGHRQLGVDLVESICGSADANASAEDVRLNVSGTPWTQGTLGNFHLTAWWQSVPDTILDNDTSSYCNSPVLSGDNAIHESVIATGDELFNEPSLQFPEDFSDVTTFTEVDLVEAVIGGDCSADVPTGENRKLLCIAIYEDTTSSDDKPIAGDYLAWAIFDVDTKPPAAPVVEEILPEDGSATIVIALPSDDDIVAYHIYSRPLDTEAGAAADCETLINASSGVTREIIESDDEVTSLSASGLKNGTTYELCVAAVDRAGNLGAGSEIQRITPREECDFAECYPGDWEKSCAQVPGSLYLLLALPLWLGRGRRRSPR